jgi:eukaryotic-like serine/threonine-protein kinase
MALPSGTRLGPYEIIATLGAGGMGEVYRARDSRLDRFVAVKVLPADVTSPLALERFEREAKAIAALNHPHICTVHDVGTADGLHFLVMELLDGESLHQRLTRGPLDVASIVETGLSLADALAAAHARGLVHRDLKPANIVLTARGPKILDFGLAKTIEQGHAGLQAHDGPGHTQAVTLSADSPLTDPGVTVGTIAYMSPEQLRGEAIDARTDVFSLGLVLYEMATGRRAFSGATSAVISAAILHDAPAAPRQLRPDLPPRLEHAILTAIEKDREIRTQTASELRAELTRIARELGSSRQISTPPTTSHVAPVPPSATAATSPASSSDAQLVAGLVSRHRGALVFAALVAIAILGGVYAVMRGRPAGDAAGSRAAGRAVASLQIDQLTSSGTAASPAISPDGKYVAYVEQGRGGDSLRVRQVATGSNVEILPAEPGVRVRGTTVTPDGGFVDYLRSARSQRVELWRIPFLGGMPQRRLDNIGSLVSWSPDGRQMAYLRSGANGRSEVVVTAADGSGERVVTTRTAPEGFLILDTAPVGSFVPAWSPDGRTLAILGLKTGAGGGTGQIVFVDVATGSQRAIDAGPPLIGSSLAWLDATTVIVSMLVKSSAPLQLWQVSFPQGALTHLTNDLNQYVGVSLTSDRNALATSRGEFTVGIWTSNAAAADWKEAVPSSPIKGPVGFSVGWAGDDIIYMGATGGEFSLLRRHTATGATETVAPLGGQASISRDGSTVVFIDFDKVGLTKMDLTRHVRAAMTGFPTGAFITPDGHDVVIPEIGPGTIRLRAIDGTGAPRVVVKARFQPGSVAVSLDAQSIAYTAVDDQNRPATIVCDIATCTSRRTLPPLRRPRWMPDGKSLTYLDGETGTNLWVQPIDGGPPRQLTHFPNDGRTIWDFAWSTDGQHLAVGRATTSNNIVLLKGLNR